MDSALNSVSKLFKAFVSLFDALFGFLPEWVMVFVGSAFIFAIGVFIYKLIRG